MTIHDTPEADVPETRHVHRANRRSVLKGAAGLAAIAGTGLGGATQLPKARNAAAQEVDGTRARSWSEDENINTDIKLEGEGWVTLQTEFPFWALGFAWDTGVGTWPAVQYGISTDGETWDDGYSMTAHSDGGPAATDDRHHTDLHFGDGQQYIRYRTVDGEGNLVVLDRFQITYIDPTDGPWEPDRGATIMRTTATNSDTLVPPTIITRAQWGANENLRYDSTGEIWPPEYQQVEHAIVHHAAVNYGSDGYNAVRSIYYYHAVTQGWGDIGYNYVVDVNGNIFEGRVGGANVIGGHAFEYANGSSGICMMGDFTSVDPPWASKVALANIVAYVTRDLDTFATKPFHAAPALPTICAHRDVNQSSCPGNALYDDLPWLRNTVKSTLDQGLLDSHKPGGIVPGDWVKVQTENSTALPMRRDPGMQYPVLANIPYGTRVEVERGPLADSQYNWYQVFYNNQAGWVPADYLLVDPPADDPADGYSYGQNLRMTTTTTLRSTPGGGAVGTVSGGSWAFIMAGPLSTAGNTWFQIRTQSNGDGWVPRSSITLAPVYNPVARFPVGSNVVTTTSTPIRVRPGIAQTTGGTTGAGTNLQISVAPIAVTDRIWYGVYGGTGTGGGWVEEGHLRAGNNPITVLGNVTASGQQFRTKQAVTMRSGPGTTFTAVTTLNSGVMGVVIGGPQTANGYSWWQVRTNADQQGWVATNYIEQIRTGSGNLTGYGIGVTVRTNTTVNLRSDGGTGYPVVATLNANTNGIIVDGPRISTGYTWWQIRTADGRLGWVAQSYIVRTSGNLPSPVGVGDSIRTTMSAVRRSNPRDASTALPAVPAGTFAAVIGGPIDVGADRWWQIKYGSEAGYVPQRSFTQANKFSAVSSVRTTQRVTTLTNVNDWSTRGNIDGNQFGALLNGPTWAHGNLWYLVNFVSGAYWIPQDYLQSANRFAVGASVRTTQQVTTLRAVDDWNTSGKIAGNVYGAVLSIPRWAFNNLWYLVAFDDQTVWVPQTYLQSGNLFSIGMSVRTTQRVTTLSDVDNWATSGKKDPHSYGAVVALPRWSFNRLWYLVSFADGNYWVPQTFLETATRFSIGDSIRTTQQVTVLGNVNDWSSGSKLPGNQFGAVVSAPRWSFERLWYLVKFNTVSVWVPQDFLDSGLKFAIGDSARTTTYTTTLTNVQNWSTNQKIGSNQYGVVLAKPQWSFNNLWYLLKFANGAFWVSQDYLESRNKFSLGDSVYTTEIVTSLGDVGNWATASKMGAGQYGAVVGNPVWSFNHLWFNVKFADGVLWIPQDYLNRGNKFNPGASVRTTVRVTSLKDVNDWSTTGKLDPNTFGSTLTSPQWAHGRLWYPVQVSADVFWIPQDFLVEDTLFTSGQLVQATTRVVLLPGPGNYANVDHLGSGEIAEIMSGPVFASGRQWYRVANVNRDGWTPQAYLELT